MAGLCERVTKLSEEFDRVEEEGEELTFLQAADTLEITLNPDNPYPIREVPKALVVGVLGKVARRLSKK